jgi:uncharacterized protein YjbI with pentapeptide repeats
MSTSLFVNNTNVYLAMIKLFLQISHRHQCETYRLDLSYLDFQGMNFSNVNLSYLNLTGVNFAGADLTGADLSHSNLTGVNFSGANLTNANISYCVITGITGIGATTTGLTSSHTSGTALVSFTGTLDEGVTFNTYNGYFFDNITYTSTARTGFSGTSTGIVTDLSSLEASTDGNFVDASGQLTFTATWKGFFYAQVSGTYEFSLSSDDGSYFWLNTYSPLRTKANATIDNSSQHPVVTKTAKVNLIGGCYYPLFMIYGQNLGDYSCSLTFTPPVSDLIDEETAWYYH